MKNRFLALGLLGITMFFFNCNSSQDPAQQTTETKVTSSLAKSSETNNEPTAPFPVFESFEDLEPIFHQKTDTTYVINFWATWCKPCVKELPYFEALHETFADQKIKVILVSLDFKRDIEKKLIPFVEEHKLKSDVIALTDGKYNDWIDKVNPEWGGAIPVTLVYSPKGKKFIGEQFANAEELNEIVQSLL